MSLEVQLCLKKGSFALEANFKVPMCGVTAILGKSGSGKTSLLRAIAGLDRSIGQIKLGESLWQSESTFCPTHERSIGYVFQDGGLFPHLTVLQNLEFGYKRTSEAQTKFELSEIIRWMNIEALLSRKATELSGGERQKVELARALLTSPQLLLLDEPLCSLDDESKAEIIQLLTRIRDEFKIPMLYVTHSREEASRFADRSILLEHGLVVQRSSK